MPRKGKPSKRRELRGGPYQHNLQNHACTRIARLLSCCFIHGRTPEPCDSLFLHHLINTLEQPFLLCHAPRRLAQQPFSARTLKSACALRV